MNNKFLNPTSGDEYVWPSNHHTENEVKRERQVEELEPAAAGWRRGVDFVRQQGTASPKRMRLSGRCGHSQHEAFLIYTNLSLDQTVFFEHCAGEVYEVLITSYQPKRVAVASNSRFGQYVWDYTIELEVIRRVT